jgi:hypothetical protein
MALAVPHLWTPRNANSGWLDRVRRWRANLAHFVLPVYNPNTGLPTYDPTTKLPTNDGNGVQCCCQTCPADYPTCPTSYSVDVSLVVGPNGGSGGCCTGHTLTLSISTTLSYVPAGTTPPIADIGDFVNQGFWVSSVYDPPEDPAPPLCDAQIALICVDPSDVIYAPICTNSSGTSSPTVTQFSWVIGVEITGATYYFAVPKTTDCPPTGTYPYICSSGVYGPGGFLNGCPVVGTPTLTLS